MHKVMITTSGRATALNVESCLRMCDGKYYLIGVDENEYSLLLSKTDEKYLLPDLNNENYLPVLREVIKETEPDFLYPTHSGDEMIKISENRATLGVKTFLPPHEQVMIFEDKFKSNKILEENGITVPESMMIENESDLKKAFSKLGSEIWLRATIGTAGKNSIAVKDYDLAVAWINRHEGWGKFMAAEKLTNRMFTWESIWFEGELVASQSRERLYWEYANRSPSGVTGISGGQKAIRDGKLHDLSVKIVKSFTDKPHGIMGIDYVVDKNGVPNPTEIQASRFYTSTHFLAKAGLNFPKMLLDIVLEDKFPEKYPIIDPIHDEPIWIKMMDAEPLMTKESEIDKYKRKLHDTIEKIGIN